MLIVSLLTVLAATEPAMSPDQPLATLRPGHPRLILTDDELPRIRRQIAEHPRAREWYERLRAAAEDLLDQPPTEYRIVGPRLLSASRSVVSRIYTLGLIYRLDGDERIGRRAVAELVAAAGWPQWNPSHFLDVAELNHAFGIGYDWLQPVLGEHRAVVRDALLEKGLAPALKGYREKAWWSRCNHNWNQVCNGGNSIGALAVADEAPEVAEEILREAVRLLPVAMKEYGPDGGWAEGPGYWGYATRYNVYVLASLETALGGDFGLSGIAGFDEAGRFRLHFVGPSGETFNYADAGAGAGGASEMFWLSRRFERPLYAWQQRTMGRGEALDLVWFNPAGDDPAAAGEPLDAFFDGVEVVFLRGSWSDPDTPWVGLKGGDNKANHSHLDLGSFTFDCLGERFVSELGGDNYNMPAYFGNRRWTYYRLKTEGQNTLLIDGANQPADADAQVLSFHSTPTAAGAVVDLTAGYPMTRRVHRGAWLENRRDLWLIDEIEADQPVEVLWHAHTAAAVTADGASAVLERDGKRLHARVVSPAGARFEARSAAQEPPQNANQGITRLTVVLPEKVTATRLTVRLSPDAGEADGPPTPLADWPNHLATRN